MASVLTQLIATGVEDAYVNGEPSMTFWKSSFARATRFALQSVAHVVDLRLPGYTSMVVGRNGDLVHGIMLQIDVVVENPALSFYPAEQLVRSVQLRIGGQLIDTIDSTWMRLRSELFMGVDERETYNAMGNLGYTDPVGSVRTLYLPIPFWFADDASKALPIVAMQYHDIRLDFQFEDPANIPGISAVSKMTAWVDYALLDATERSWFAQNDHTYLIEQTQAITSPVALSTTAQLSYSVKLGLNHPVRYLVFACVTGAHGVFTASGKPFESNEAYAPIDEAKLQINGIDQFDPRPGGYFRLVQPWQRIRGAGSGLAGSSTAVGSAPSCGVYMYNFGINAGGRTPAGTFNMSTVDTVSLQLSFKAASATAASGVMDMHTTVEAAASAITGVRVFARNFNVLKVQGGFGGVLFSG
jgi:hypothetical protein